MYFYFLPVDGSCFLKDAYNVCELIAILRRRWFLNVQEFRFIATAEKCVSMCSRAHNMYIHTHTDLWIFTTLKIISKMEAVLEQVAEKSKLCVTTARLLYVSHKHNITVRLLKLRKPKKQTLNYFYPTSFFKIYFPNVHGKPTFLPFLLPKESSIKFLPVFFIVYLKRYMCRPLCRFCVAIRKYLFTDTEVPVCCN